MKIKYRQRVYIYFFGLFTLFTVVILLFIRDREETLKTALLESDQLVYVNVIQKYIEENNLSEEQMDSVKTILNLFPESLRLTIIKEDGEVLLDNIPSEYVVDDEKLIEESEVKKALLKGKGSNIRKSTFMPQEYMYFAVYYDYYVIRVALPFNVVDTGNYFGNTTSFFYFISSLFVMIFILLSLIYARFRKSILKLKNFVISFENNKAYPKISLPDDELNEIGRMIVKIYKQIESNEKNIHLEREKLLGHFQFSEEGISFFTPGFVNLYTNSYFIQYLNIILDEPTFDVTSLFNSPVFSEVVKFINKPGRNNIFKTKIHSHGQHFNVRIIIFDDNSFEIIIKDVSENERSRILKAEMTNNIAHELKTPVTSVRAYLETILENKTISPEKKNVFIERAYIQTIRLSEIIQDVILLTKTDELPQNFDLEDINIYDMVQELMENLQDKLDANKKKVNINLQNNVIIRGNRTLLYSVFRNLLDNSIKYGGNTILINNYMQDKEYYYFSFSDNGSGVEEKHLNSLFERFYRISEGRTRDSGGSGLGLSIVKNAVSFHKGKIVAKLRPDGGLEFLFTLKKTKTF